MDPYSGKTYTDEQIPYLPSDIAGRLVRVDGKPEDVAQLARANCHYAASTSDDRKRRRAAGKAAKASRRKNR